MLSRLRRASLNTRPNDSASASLLFAVKRLSVTLICFAFFAVVLVAECVGITASGARDLWRDDSSRQGGRLSWPSAL
jgi:hypothetical protein